MLQEVAMDYGCGRCADLFERSALQYDSESKWALVKIPYLDELKQFK